ncbi:MAG: hypothetical protein AAFX95_23030 [Cyanobacteria bacterium J06639_16]
MAKRLEELDIQLTKSRLSILRPENEYFLQGQRPEATLDSLWEGWKTVGKVLVGLGLVAVLAVIGLLGYLILWNSPLAVEVEGTIDDYQNGTVNYHYVVDGTQYDKAESSSMSVSNWDEGNIPYPVIYLSFRPAISRLEHNVEPIPWVPGAFLLAIAVGIPWLGRYTIHYTQRMITLRDEATHILQGEIYQAFRGQKGTVNYLYKTTSPTTGKNIGGMVTLGRLNPRFGRIDAGSTVAILYKDDKLHELL